jgi:GntR family transcriptional regulator
MIASQGTKSDRDINMSLAVKRVDRGSAIPYYLQVCETLRNQITSERWNAGDQIPGELALCKIFGVSRPVIRQAIACLIDEGLLVRHKGKGTYLAESKIREGLFQRQNGFHQDMVEQGFSLTSRVLKFEVTQANENVAYRLGLEPGSQVIEIARLRLVHNEPVALVTTFLPYDLCATLIQEDLSRQSLYAVLERCCGLVITHGRQTFKVTLAGTFEAHLLNIQSGAPLVALDKVSYLNDGRPVEYSNALHRADRTRFEVELVRVQKTDDARPILDALLDTLPSSNGIIFES